MGNSIFCHDSFNKIREMVIFNIRQNNVREFQRYIIDFNIKPDTIIDKWSWNSLHLSVFYGSFDVVYYLLIIHKIDPNCMDIRGWAPLHIAILKNNMDILKLLLECGAKVHKKTILAYPYLFNQNQNQNMKNKYYVNIYKKTGMCDGFKLARVLSKWKILNLFQKRKMGNFHSSLIDQYVCRHPTRKNAIPSSKLLDDKFS